MKLASHINAFRIFSALVLLTVAVLPVWLKPNITSAIVFYPIVLISLMSVIALVEQHLLLKKQINEDEREKAPVKVHKLQMKKVRSHRHIGCRLLGLSCAA